MNFLDLFTNPIGRTSRGQYIGGLIPFVAAVVFYYLLVKGLNGEWVLFTLLYPAFMLHARRLHDMGLTAWLLILPGALIGVAIRPHVGPRTALENTLAEASLAVMAVIALWCCIAKGKADANRFGATAAA